MKSYHWIHRTRTGITGRIRGGADGRRSDGNPMKTTPPTRRALLNAAGACTLAGPATAEPAAGTSGEAAVAMLAARSETANDALLRGDLATYRSLITLSEDFTLMSPFGGEPSRGVPSADGWQRLGRFLRNGALRQELVQAYGGADMVVLAVIEHGHGEVGGLPAQDWPLRVTLVYRRAGADWQLVHRHADPLARGVSQQHAAALARAEFAAEGAR
jgi:hypothetical protein